MDKYQMIDTLITKVDAMIDAHGVTRCMMTIDIIQQLNALKELLKGEGRHDEGQTE